MTTVDFYHIIKLMKVDVLFTGQTIRILRERLKLSQKELCSGICTVSYLSKIERDEAKCHEEIKRKLLGVLGFRELEKDEDDEIRITLSGFFDSAVEIHPDEKILAAIREKALKSRYFLSFCLAWAMCHEKKDAEDEFSVLESQSTILSPDLKAFYFMIKADECPSFEEMLSYASLAWKEKKRADTASFYLYALYCNGRVSQFLKTLDEAELIAVRSGALVRLAEIYSFAASTYNLSSSMENCYEHYKMALGIYERLNMVKEADETYYNLASCLLDEKKSKEALFYLGKIKNPEKVYLFHHKMCLALLMEGRKDEAEKELEIFKEDKSPLSLLFQNVLEFRLRYDCYLTKSVYLEALDRLYKHLKENMHFSFISTYAKDLVEALKAQRKYQRALFVTEEMRTLFSSEENFS